MAARRILPAVFALALAAQTAPAGGAVALAASPTCNGLRPTIIGTASADLLRGTDGRDVVWAGDGADLVEGLRGADVLCAGAGDDEIRGGGGSDWIDGGPGDDLVSGGLGNDSELGGGYEDVFIENRHSDYISHDVPKRIPDHGTATSTINVLHGSPATIYDVNVRVCILHQHTRDLVVDLVSPKGTVVRLAEHRGNGTPLCEGNRSLGAVFDSEAFTTIRSPGTKPLDGRFHPEWSFETLGGQQANGAWKLVVADTRTGNVGKLAGWSIQIAFGSPRSDGSDSIRGEDGVDLVDFAGRTAPLHVSLGEGADDGQAAELDDIGADVESVYGGEGGDYLRGTDGPNELRGRAGNDTLIGLSGDDDFLGGLGNDGIFAGPGADWVLADDGNDRIDGGRGADVVAFGRSLQPVVVDLETGVATGQGDDTLANVEDIGGSSFGDRLTGDAAVNVLDGGKGNDVVRGRSGDDDLDGGAGSDGLDGGNGIDKCVHGEQVTACEP